ncbi:MAG: NADP-dependent oxidoreductase [Chloroflexi bacterium]|nr:NADP-dependent oxidoreductase [Chloroflexota bacterium]
MPEDTNRSWTLASRPNGAPKLTDFELKESPIPTPGAGEILIATRYHSLDPYMRGRMNPPTPAAYTAPVPVGGVMESDSVGEVIASNSDLFNVGDIAMGKIGWQEYGVLDGRDARKIDPDAAPISTSVGILGMPGLTAYFGLFDVGNPIAGDTVVVSAASGAVGAVVGQLAKINGCRVIGVAGSDEKVSYVVDELGFDAGVNYKTENVAERFQALCPDGINVYWDNVGGPITDAAVDHLAIGGRAVICGQIALYNATSPPQGPRNIARMLLTRRARMEGFLVFQFSDRFQEGLDRLAMWIRDGSLKYREDVVDGIENSPTAFIGLLNGANFGKLVVKVS